MARIRYPNFTYGFPGMIHEFARMRRDMERLFADLTGVVPDTLSSGVFPAINVTDDADAVRVEAEMPGIRPENLDISVMGKTLTLRGERKLEEVENAGYHRRERRGGCFHKAVTLPNEVNSEKIAATFKDGVLRLVLPKAEHAAPKRITVQAA
jgi:HSP20 family protein